jgi:hypothetical protein
VGWEYPNTIIPSVRRRAGSKWGTTGLEMGAPWSVGKVTLYIKLKIARLGHFEKPIKSESSVEPGPGSMVGAQVPQFSRMCPVDPLEPPETPVFPICSISKGVATHHIPGSQLH